METTQQDRLAALLARIGPADEAARAEAARRWAACAKPLGSLGLLETALEDIAALTGSADIALEPREVLVFCADNGVVAQGVAQSDSSVTRIVTRNLVFNQCRKEVNENYYKMTVLPALESSYDIEEEIAARDLSRYIDRLIEELPEKRRQIFNLSRKAHKSHKEIALLLGISEKTVENQIREALRFLRKNMLLLICFLV